MKHRIGFSVVTFSFFVVGILIAGLNMFRVSDIDCYVHGEKIQSSQCAYFDELHDYSLFFTNFEDFDEVKNITMQNDSGGSYYYDFFRKRLPGLLEINLTTEPPLYRVVFDNEEKVLITRQGEVKQNNDDLEIIEIVNAFQSRPDNNILSPDLERHRFYSTLLFSLDKKKIGVKKIEVVSENEIVLHLKSGQIALLDFTKNPELEVERLSIVLLQLDRIDDESMEKIWNIDLRFIHPVLKP